MEGETCKMWRKTGQHCKICLTYLHLYFCKFVNLKISHNICKSVPMLRYNNKNMNHSWTSERCLKLEHVRALESSLDDGSDLLRGNSLFWRKSKGKEKFFVQFRDKRENSQAAK